jgi:capsular polysaccharide biosynthesis protein
MPKVAKMTITMFQRSQHLINPARVIDEVINELEQSETAEALKPNYEVEELKLRLDTTQDSLYQERADKKQLEEK